ncbi:hypothetical protein IID04_07785, partial [PVC group bacterium]|nr:hypothetical protein [PVC group bacterium]
EDREDGKNNKKPEDRDIERIFREFKGVYFTKPEDKPDTEQTQGELGNIQFKEKPIEKLLPKYERDNGENSYKKAVFYPFVNHGQLTFCQKATCIIILLLLTSKVF